MSPARTALLTQVADARSAAREAAQTAAEQTTTILIEAARRDVLVQPPELGLTPPPAGRKGILCCAPSALCHVSVTALVTVTQ